MNQFQAVELNFFSYILLHNHLMTTEIYPLGPHCRLGTTGLSSFFYISKHLVKKILYKIQVDIL